MKCTQCGNEIPDGSKFCNSCGAKVEIETPKEIQTEQWSTSVRKLLKEKKGWVIGYAVWVVVNLTFLIFGREDYFTSTYSFSSVSAKKAFFPFKGDASNYDFSEFFVYVIALPIVVYAAYYLYDNYYVKKKIKLPKISSKVAMWCIPLAFVISLIVYAIAMKPVEHYVLLKNHDNNPDRRFVHMDVSKAEIPSFLGDTYEYMPYNTFLTYKRYPLYYLKANEGLHYPKMPLLFRLRVAYLIMRSWKGLRFFMLMWLLSYGVVVFIKSKTQFKLKSCGVS